MAPALVLLLAFAATLQDPPASPAGDAAPRAGGWRLADSASLYLRDHAADPVEWHPWGDEAFARAPERATASGSTGATA